MDKRHGGPYDRGSADSYYQRGPCPHYYVEGTTVFNLMNPHLRVEEKDMTEQEIAEYMQGFNDNEKIRNFKDYGHDY